ncbi:transketolase [Amycolatopsis xylanica]|uniref:Transketolase n=1 Tax=Amycolatopsis xylanica TaxID=589385 RepID=A0A1H3EWW0_9PSEU|nr:transketolase C-terminal domain-containing protein [Amycolatopsis xylanica]SDX83283.1 transketolase [Amycolatopsis xylanica]
MTDGLSRVPTAEFERVLAGVPDRYDRARAFATLARINTLYMVMRAGSGHLGSSFSAMDVVAALLLEELDEPFAENGDVYFSSKGHDAPGLYAALIGLGALDEDLVHRLRRIGGLPGHPDVHTPHMPFNTGSLGMGISKAKGLILADRLRGVTRRVFVLTGDGELQEGQNYEALAGAVHRGMGELTVVVDHNKIQSDTWVRDVNDLGDLPARFAGFGWAVLRCDGHDPQAIDAVLRKRFDAHAGQPAVIIADTIKGGGCATFAATSMGPDEWRYLFHSGAPSTEDYRTAHRELVDAATAILRANGLGDLVLAGEAPAAPRPAGGERLVPAYGEALVARAARHQEILALDADLVLDTGLIPFSQTYPERFVEFGIAEQDMVSAAGGLASQGFLPFVHSFSCFLLARANEQIYNNATEDRKIVYVGTLAGLLPAAPGHSHQAVRDVGSVAAVPGLAVLTPCNIAEVGHAVDFCVSTSDSVYLRLASTAVPAAVAALPTGPLVAGRGRVVREGGSTIAIGAGPVVLAELLSAAEELKADGIELTVVNLPWLNRVDPDWLAELTDGAESLFVVEDHYLRGGQADTVARTLLELGGTPPRFRGIGVDHVPQCGTEAEALAAHGLSARQLADAIRGERPAVRLDITVSPR